MILTLPWPDRTLYPGAQTRLARQKDHNRAEALLLAHYGLRRLA